MTGATVVSAGPSAHGASGHLLHIHATLHLVRHQATYSHRTSARNGSCLGRKATGRPDHSAAGTAEAPRHPAPVILFGPVPGEDGEAANKGSRPRNTCPLRPRLPTSQRPRKIDTRRVPLASAALDDGQRLSPLVRPASLAGGLPTAASAPARASWQAPGRPRRHSLSQAAQSRLGGASTLTLTTARYARRAQTR